jgi:hypothetical protein
MDDKADKVEGEWIGHYVDPTYGDRKFGLTAVLSVARGALTGAMRDADTTLTITIEDAMRQPWPDGSDLQEWLLFASQYPDAVCTTMLPEHSRLNGTVLGNAVRFTKRYIGREQVRWAAQGVEFQPEERECGTVIYEGVLNEQCTEIVGTWTVYTAITDEGAGKALGTGPFRLTRNPNRQSLFSASKMRRASRAEGRAR